MGLKSGQVLCKPVQPCLPEMTSLFCQKILWRKYNCCLWICSLAMFYLFIYFLVKKVLCSFSAQKLLGGAGEQKIYCRASWQHYNMNWPLAALFLEAYKPISSLLCIGIKKVCLLRRGVNLDNLLIRSHNGYWLKTPTTYGLSKKFNVKFVINFKYVLIYQFFFIITLFWTDPHSNG